MTGTRPHEPGRADVVVVGAGPVGVAAANLLGRYGVDTLVVDRAGDVIDYPRAIGIDDESLRTFQATGLVTDILPGTIQNVPLKLIDARGRCLADVRPAGRPYGWYRRNIFMQPQAERVLRRGLDRFANVRLVLGTVVGQVDQDVDGVTVHLTDDAGRPRQVRADYVIAADGGRSTVRTGLGIELEGTTHGHKWVVIDCANDPLDAPYTALHCDPLRPYVCAHMPDDHRRWEFMLFPGEDADEMLAPERVRELLSRHVADPGAVQVIRARVYTHHSRLATRFVQGRIALAGDAAHLMPPWAGQGMNTGFRDVMNLCWKLAAVVRDGADPALLGSYETERREHAKAMIDMSTTLGRFLSPTNRPVARLRDAVLHAAAAAPALKRWILEMGFKPVADHRTGFTVADGSDGMPVTAGRMMPQPVVETADGEQVPLDEVLGPWFAVVGFERDPLGGLTESQLAALDRFRPTVIKVVESRAGRRHHDAPRVRGDTLVVEDVENQLRPWFQSRGRPIVLIRPDRYVAVSATAEAFGPAVAALAARFTGA